ncbi:hypothetical protein CJ216_03995 [Gardnerella greenwoodii]|uniref:Uncharacterized protein n=1 Tax=Gardnerella greenwoodii TaxID=2914925 RepID=A0A2N6RYQ2_9BIFI|nr:hypothetical protein CJ216_03995 [Gardnerella greenwoodii]
MATLTALARLPTQISNETKRKVESANAGSTFLLLWREFSFAVARVLGDFSPRTSRPSGALAVKDV